MGMGTYLPLLVFTSGARLSIGCDNGLAGRSDSFVAFSNHVEVVVTLSEGALHHGGHRVSFWTVGRPVLHFQGMLECLVDVEKRIVEVSEAHSRDRFASQDICLKRG